MDFADLYTRYAADVFRFAFYLSGDRMLAEDIAAETFARALTSGGRVAQGSVKAYLLAIARHLFVDGVRAGKRTTPLEAAHLDLPDPRGGPDALAAALRRLERRAGRWRRRCTRRPRPARGCRR